MHLGIMLQVITGMIIVPACMALGVVIFMDHDTRTCQSSLELAAMCSKVEYAATSYLLAGSPQRRHRNKGLFTRINPFIDYILLRLFLYTCMCRNENNVYLKF